MASRDPNKTARNKQIKAIKERKRLILNEVIEELARVGYSQYDSEPSINAFIGGKIYEYIDIRSQSIYDPYTFTSLYLTGLKRKYDECIERGSDGSHVRLYESLNNKENENFRLYVKMFLNQSFLKHYSEHVKKKPNGVNAEYWFGPNADVFGLLVSPRYNEDIERWENDGSEVRKFSKPYWTLGHLVEVGLCYIDENRTRTFDNIDSYLQFFYDAVRRTKSPYQIQVADLYMQHVSNYNKPEQVPVLIPEYRFDPYPRSHVYRLDYLIINPWTLERIGFEISPWSTHGKLTGKHKNLTELNKDALANFEGEMRKQKRFWRERGIHFVIYTDEDLADIPNRVWPDILSALQETPKVNETEFAIFDELLGE